MSRDKINQGFMIVNSTLMYRPVRLKWYMIGQQCELWIKYVKFFILLIMESHNFKFHQLPGLHAIMSSNGQLFDISDDFARYLGYVSGIDFLENSNHLNYLDIRTKAVELADAFFAEDKKVESKRVQTIAVPKAMQPNFSGLENKAIIQLTLREKQCANLLLHGMSSRGMSEKLNLSYRTIESHMTSLKQKLNCENKSELMAFLLQNKNLYF